MVHWDIFEDKVSTNSTYVDLYYTRSFSTSSQTGRHVFQVLRLGLWKRLSHKQESQGRDNFKTAKYEGFNKGAVA